jgi:hypothetical protein
VASKVVAPSRCSVNDRSSTFLAAGFGLGRAFGFQGQQAVESERILDLLDGRPDSSKKKSRANSAPDTGGSGLRTPDLYGATLPFAVLLRDTQEHGVPIAVGAES